MWNQCQRLKQWFYFTFDGRSPFAVVKDGKFSKDFSRGKNTQEFAFARDLNFALWKWN